MWWKQSLHQSKLLDYSVLIYFFSTCHVRGNTGPINSSLRRTWRTPCPSITLWPWRRRTTARGPTSSTCGRPTGGSISSRHRESCFVSLSEIYTRQVRGDLQNQTRSSVKKQNCNHTQQRWTLILTLHALCSRQVSFSDACSVFKREHVVRSMWTPLSLTVFVCFLATAYSQCVNMRWSQHVNVDLCTCNTSFVRCLLDCWPYSGDRRSSTVPHRTKEVVKRLEVKKKKKKDLLQLKKLWLVPFFGWTMKDAWLRVTTSLPSSKGQIRNQVTWIHGQEICFL